MLVFAPSVCVRVCLSVCVCVWRPVVGVGQCETVHAHTPVLILVSQPPFVGTHDRSLFANIGDTPCATCTLSYVWCMYVRTS